MNRERFEHVASWLEAGAPERGRVEGFNLGYTIVKPDKSCGTICCIAGATVEFYDKAYADSYLEIGEFLRYMAWYDLCERARELLGITEDEARELFNPMAAMDGKMIANSQWRPITPQWAGQCVRHFMATREVDWRKAYDDLQAKTKAPALTSPEEVTDRLMDMFAAV